MPNPEFGLLWIVYDVDFMYQQMYQLNVSTINLIVNVVSAFLG